MKIIILLLLITALLSAQTIYKVTPDSKNNQIQLTIANESASSSAQDIEIKYLEKPLPILFSENVQYLEMLEPGEEAEVMFEFDIERDASINKKDTLKFVIKDGIGGTWTKTIILEYQPPQNFVLEQNYPNPFNPITSIQYQLPVEANVELQVYDMLGRKVTTLVNEKKEAGFYTATFDASRLASGIYIYRLTAGKYTKSVKMMVLK